MMTNNPNDEQYEWISVSELATRIGKTKQTAYNQVKQGMYETKTFRRQSMIGILVKVPKENV